MQINKYLLILFILIFLILPIRVGAESPSLRNIALDSKIYDYLSYLEAKGEISPVFTGSFPLSYAEVEQVLIELGKKNELTSVQNRIYNYLAQELKAGSSLADKFYYSNQLNGRFLNNSEDNDSGLNLKSAIWTGPNEHFFAETRLELTAGRKGNYGGLSLYLGFNCRRR